MTKSFVSAIKGVRQPPCERWGGCEHYQRCAKEKLACRDFLSYCKEIPKLRTAVIRNPTRAMYLKIFPGDAPAREKDEQPEPRETEDADAV